MAIEGEFFGWGGVAVCYDGFEFGASYAVGDALYIGVFGVAEDRWGFGGGY